MRDFIIPMGFRFDPTDEECVKFLTLKVNREPLPWDGVVYKDLYGPNATPWVVFSGHRYWQTKKEGGATKSTTFVFTNLIRVPNSKKFCRIAGIGTWSGQTGPRQILSSETGKLIGHMRMLSFTIQDSGGALLDSGHWNMHEYYLNHGTAAAADLVVCKITRSVKGPGKRAASGECSFQERKVQKFCGDLFAAEVKPPPEYFFPQATAYVEEGISCKEEKLGDGGTFSEVAATGEDDGNIELLGGGDTAVAATIAEGDDSRLHEALEHDGNIEPLCGDSNTAGGAAFPLDDLLSSSLFDVAAEDDPLLVSPPSPFEYDFSFDMDSFFDDIESLW